MRNFDLRDELRATADRRKQAAGAGQASGVRGEGIAQMAERLAAMFPGLPRDTVQAVLSELFRADASCSREELADRAVSALLEMCFASGSEEFSVTSYEPVSVDGSDLPEPSAPPLGEVQADPLEPSAPPLDELADEWSEALDSHLASFLALPDDVLQVSSRTLVSILGRIADDPGNERVRRLRLANARFSTEVGQHEAAVDLLRLAGFEDDAGPGGEDKALVLRGSPAASTAFGRVQEALHGVAAELFPAAPAGCSAVSTGSGSSATGGRELGQAHRRSQSRRQRRIAELTEQRLRDPRAFRQQAEARGAANRARGGQFGARAPPQGRRASPQRRSQHFTLADIDRMRVAGEIASTPSYAEEYRQRAQGGAAHDYSTLVSRSYDPELISRQALDGTNQYRASKGLPPCRWNAGIARIAAEHAAQMASGAAPFSHDGFNARASAFPVAHRGAAENLALNSGVSDVARVAVDGWIKSPGHERNLRGNYNLCGIGAARSASGTFYLTQLFALAA